MLLSFYRRLLEVRNETSALVHGELRLVHGSGPNVLSFIRSTSLQIVLGLLNFSPGKVLLDYTDLNKGYAQVIFSSSKNPVDNISEIRLEPFEIWIAELNLV